MSQVIKFQNEFQSELISFKAQYNFTDQEIAKMIDVSVPSVRRWLLGETEPHEAIKKIFQREKEKISSIEFNPKQKLTN